MSGITVTSLYGAKERKPLVHLAIDGGESELQCSPEEARSLALNLLQAAEAAESDAFIFEFGAKGLGKPDDRAGAVLLVEFRTWRERAQIEGTS